MAAELDELVASFRSRPLDGGPCAFLWLDAPVQQVREGGRTVNGGALVAAGVNADGHREIRLAGAVLAEQHDEWTEARRHVGLEILAACRKTAGGPETAEAEVTIEPIIA